MKHPVAVIPGDGIGKEVVTEARRVLERAGDIDRLHFMTMPAPSHDSAEGPAATAPQSPA